MKKVIILLLVCALVGVLTCLHWDIVSGTFVGVFTHARVSPEQAGEPDAWSTEFSRMPDDGVLTEADLARHPLIVNLTSLQDGLDAIDNIERTGEITPFGGFVLDDDMRAEVQGALDEFLDNRISVAFLLMDLETGGGLAYNIDERYYSASTTKAPYICALSYYVPQCFYENYYSMKMTLVESSNNHYSSLFSTYDPNIVNWWRRRAGLGNQQWGACFTFYSVAEWAKLWLVNWDYLNGTDDERTQTIKNWLSVSDYSAFEEALGEEVTRYSKSGWDSTEYRVSNDGGVVVRQEGTYLLCVMTEKWGQPQETATPLVKALDDAYCAYAPHRLRW